MERSLRTERDLIGEDACFPGVFAVFEGNSPDFLFSGRTLGVEVEQSAPRQHQIGEAKQ